jgi:hypothetical protein
LLRQNEPAAARLVLDEAIARYRAQHDELNADAAYGSLGRALHALGDLAGARANFARSLRLREQAGEPRPIAVSLENLARLDHHEHHSRRAARLLAAAHAIRTAINAPISSGQRADHARFIEAVRAALGEVAFGQAWAEGSALSQAAAVALALSPPAQPPQR